MEARSSLMSLWASSSSKAFLMQFSMPRPSTSTFMNFRASMSSLSHSMIARSLHGGGLDGHEFVQPVLGQHEPAGMLAELPRRADQLAGQLLASGAAGGPRGSG